MFYGASEELADKGRCGICKSPEVGGVYNMHLVVMRKSRYLWRYAVSSVGGEREREREREIQVYNVYVYLYMHVHYVCLSYCSHCLMQLLVWLSTAKQFLRVNTSQHCQLAVSSLCLPKFKPLTAVFISWWPLDPWWLWNPKLDHPAEYYPTPNAHEAGPLCTSC